METNCKVRQMESSDPACHDECIAEQQAIECPLVSVIMPAFNEAAILWSTLTTVCEYMESMKHRCPWELIVVNDGSSDRTGELAEAFASLRKGVLVLHHPRNFGLGQALKSGFDSSQGKYVVVLDADLSYSPDHIGKLLDQIQLAQAKIVVASPYAKGGRVTDVPWLRRVMSRWANRFLSSVARCSLSTLTGMVRMYDGQFIRALNLRSRGMEVSPEIIYKSLLLGAQIEEIPAHLDWKLQRTPGNRRTSSMKVMPHVVSTILSGFIFRPFMFFLVPGLSLLALAIYTNTWMFIHVYEEYLTLAQDEWFLVRASAAMAQAYQAFPHTFIVGGLSLTLAIQLIGLGMLSLQSKHYFEELLHLGNAIYKQMSMRGGEGKRSV
jgi:glycosyltransferase involved in cell wall biosynthesis